MNDKILIKIICLIGFFTWAWLLVQKYYCLGYYDWDFAFFSQAMWSLSHGSSHVSLFDINFFSNHANLFALILVPLYKIFPHPLTLLILKLLSFFIASYMLYLLAKEKLGTLVAFIVLYLYWLYPPNIYGLVYEFDFENLAPAFIMLVFYFYSKDKWIPFLISSIFLISIKENMPLIVLAFGLHGLFTKSNKITWGLIPTALGGLSFYVLAFIFVPLMGAHSLGQHPYSVHYPDLNATLLTHPIQSARHIITAEKLQWLVCLFGFLPLSLLSPGILFLVSPIIIQHFLSVGRQEHIIYYSYTLTIAPFIFLALIYTLARIKNKFSRGKYYFMILLSITLSLIFLFEQKDIIKNRYMSPASTMTYADAWQLLKMVPPQAPVAATFRFLPELSQRPYVYSFHKTYDPAYQNKNISYHLPENVHYALVDSHDDWLLSTLIRYNQSTRLNIKKFLIGGGWKAKYNRSGITLYER